MRSPEELIDVLISPDTGFVFLPRTNEYLLRAAGNDIGRISAGLPEIEFEGKVREMWNTWLAGGL